jgi:hypothetical protein
MPAAVRAPAVAIGRIGARASGVSRLWSILRVVVAAGRATILREENFRLARKYASWLTRSYGNTATTG